MERFYRSRICSPEWVSFTVQVKETDLWVRAKRDFSDRIYERVFQHRHALETYIRYHPRFVESLIPWKTDPTAPAIIQAMIQAGAAAGVGPMAAVAGAIAEFVGTDLLPEAEEIIIENGGDLFIAVKEAVTVGIYAGTSPLSGKIGIRLSPLSSPRGVCTSSGTVGHSWSFGQADAVTILAPSAALADAVATATGNRVKTRKDIPSALDWVRTVPSVEGALIIVGDQLGVWGGMELVAL